MEVGRGGFCVGARSEERSGAFALVRAWCERVSRWARGRGMGRWMDGWKEGLTLWGEWK